ncbi:MAG: U32 family peptidase [Defluviitaleaceae bacterium]|nr:U32 family peptidase [Defluviitaleaceae bacterium]
MTKPEILSPAGDFLRLQLAIAYGADAVYLGGASFSLRANAKNFDDSELARAVMYAHAHGVRVYAGVNIFARNNDIRELAAYLEYLKSIKIDAIIVSDLGVFALARQVLGADVEIHISTQANVTNYQSAMMYEGVGASRVILARELSLNEITEINDKCKSDSFSTEVFVHGAMCVSYSGRCLLSNYMTANNNQIIRDGNRGDCAQPCRWKYALVEETRPGQYYPIEEEDGFGTYIMNAKDLCMIEHIPALVASGVSSFKIEGRMRSPYYAATVTQAYRRAVDDYFADPAVYESNKNKYLKELKKSAYRDFCTGFFFGMPENGQDYVYSGTDVAQDFCGIIDGYDTKTSIATLLQRNKFSVGDRVEFIKAGYTQTITEMFDEEGAVITSAPHPKQKISIKTDRPVDAFDIMRRIN